MKTDESDIKDIVSTVGSMFDPFMESDELASISTVIKASVITERDLFSDLGNFTQKCMLTNDVLQFYPRRFHAGM